MGAGAGYSTELMARCVGSTGKVYGQVDERSEKLRARMTMPVMGNVTVLVRPSDDPVPSDLHDLDLITFYFAYHDTTCMPIDRDRMKGRCSRR
jgi:predicted methyltransferase